jgi:sister-chromatid-cohesion protein PDS5
MINLADMTSRGVKAYAACCLADLLRLYAPDAPFSQDELRVRFSPSLTLAVVSHIA